MWCCNLDASESFEMSWRRMEKMSRTDRVESEQILHRIKDEGIILHKIKRSKATWIGHILRRNCRLKYVIAGRI